MCLIWFCSICICLWLLGFLVSWLLIFCKIVSGVFRLCVRLLREWWQCLCCLCLLCNRWFSEWVRCSSLCGCFLFRFLCLLDLIWFSLEFNLCIVWKFQVRFSQSSLSKISRVLLSYRQSCLWNFLSRFLNLLIDCMVMMLQVVCLLCSRLILMLNMKNFLFFVLWVVWNLLLWLLQCGVQLIDLLVVEVECQSRLLFWLQIQLRILVFGRLNFFIGRCLGIIRWFFFICVVEIRVVMLVVRCCLMVFFRVMLKVCCRVGSSVSMNSIVRVVVLSIRWMCREWIIGSVW